MSYAQVNIMTPHDLAAWAERAKPEEQRAVMDAAWRMLRGDASTPALALIAAIARA